MNTGNTNKGKVILIGAGPGDPELITMKAVRHLQRADVVLTDRLVSEVILQEYVNADAEVIYVGKQCRTGLSTPQEYINELIVEHYSKGKYVVRLKGGDVSIFSNVFDELEELVKHQIPYEIVPGITAALGAAAYSGIPLTARNYAIAVRFLTYYRSDIVTDTYWKELAGTDDTLVFYMSAETIDGVITNLIKYGVKDDRKVAIVEQATTPMQQVMVSGVYEYHQKLQGIKLKSPSLVIIGKVVGLHESFAWLQNGDSRANYFKTVATLKNDIKQNNQEEHVSRA
ncbi:MAG: uroporphyrinogen-III C-methyltransferase [Bacteroidetes bacterium]|nr:MAG: uroporphyrinogen-III C-methyltransferase [Bacteroidota bacterium]